MSEQADPGRDLAKRHSQKSLYGTGQELRLHRLELNPDAAEAVRRIGSDLDGVCPLRRQGHHSREPRIGRRSARRRDLIPVRVEVPVIRASEHDHEARPAMMMQVLALAGLDRDLEHPHLVILM